jgi:pentatricopeptide repeat protein
MRRTNGLVIIFFLLRGQAFVLKNTGRKGGSKTSASSLNSVSPFEKVCNDAHDEIVIEGNSISELTSFILDSEGVEVGSLSGNALDKVFPLLLTWGKMETTEAAITVERLLERLEREMETGNKLVSLNNKHYTIAIDAWGKSGHTDAARRAENILEKMEKMLKLNPSVAPTRATYNALMNAHSRNGDVDRIAELLGFMEDMPSLQPITSDYNVLLSAHAKLGEAREAENVVQKMINRSQEPGRAGNCEPDLYSYNMLLDAWSKSNEPNRGKRAEAILAHLCEHSEFEGEPDARTYSAAICAVVHSGEENILERSERILAQAESNDIDSDVYLESLLLDAYASSKSPGSARRAEELLNKLDEKGIANAVSFNTVIKAWKSSNDPDGPVRAKRIVERMKELGIVDTISYSTLIATYANTGNRDSAERAEAILEDMHAMDLTPNIRTLNARKFRIFGL